MGAIKRWLDRRRRRIDMDLLWNVCLEVAGDRETAKKAFFWHVRSDPAWTDYFTEDELSQFVSDL